MHYFSVFVKRIFCAVLLLGLLLSVSCPVFAAEGDIKIDETKSLFDDMFKSIQSEREKLPTSAPVLSPSLERER